MRNERPVLLSVALLSLALASAAAPWPGFERGMGMGGWLTNYKRFNVLPESKRLLITEGDLEHFDTFITERDVERVATMGFDHIRLGFDQIVLEEAPGKYRERTFRKIDDFVGWCGKYGLNAVLNLHKAVGNYCDIPEKVQLLDDETLQRRFVELWVAIERRYRDRPGLAFEILNEVRDVDPAKWNALADRCLRAIRAENPTRWVVIGSTCWNSPSRLKDLRVWDDPRVVYTFHMYEPFGFTHQRGVLQAGPLAYNRELAYPSKDVERYRGLNRVHGRKPGFDGVAAIDRDFLKRQLKGALDFAKAHPDKILWNGEFGTIRHAPPESRVAYMRDIVSICREAGIPWCVWNYLSTPNDGNRFSLVDDGTRKILSPELLAACLGEETERAPERVMLWPEGKMPSVQTNQTYRPYLTWFTPPRRTSRAVLIAVSGGGYGGCGDGGFEVAPMRDYMLAKGVTVVTMRYRTPRPVGLAKHVTAWQDAQRTVRLVRSEAARRGLDPENIGFTGCSAGGHLAMMVAVSSQTPAYAPVDEIDRLPCHVNWAIPVYPAYLLADGADRHNATGGNDLSLGFVPELAFDAATPAMCFFHGDLDGWSAMGSVRAYHKLRTMGIPAELHVLARETHCFQSNPRPGTTAANWKDVAWSFLVSIDAVTGHPMTWRKGWTGVIGDFQTRADCPKGAWKRTEWGGQVLAAATDAPLLFKKPFGDFTVDFEYRVPRGGTAELIVGCTDPKSVCAARALPLVAADPTVWHRLTVRVSAGAATAVRDGVAWPLDAATDVPAAGYAGFRASPGFALRNVRFLTSPP